MNLMDKLERKLGRFAIHGLMKYICVAMLGVFLLDILPLGSVTATGLLSFNKEKILSGEVWRVITFLVIPPSQSVLFILFTLYFYYFLGTTLENTWGSPKFNIYYLFGWLGCVLSGFLAGRVDNTILNMSLFLAFAMLYPHMQVNLFFFLPVQMKYIAIFDAVYLLCIFIMASSWPTRLSMLLCMLPFFLFFGRDLYYMVRRAIMRFKNR